MKKFSLIFIVLVIVTLSGWHISERSKKADVPVPENKPIAVVLYSCKEGNTIQAQYYKGESQAPVKPGEPPIPTGSVQLKLSDGRAMEIPQTISADGIRYANADETFIFWGKGDGALVLENNSEKSYIGCIKIADAPAGSDLSNFYSDPSGSFSLRFSEGYAVDPSYRYDLERGKKIAGVKFTIPPELAEGTNLSNDSYLSVETLPMMPECTADLFLYDKTTAQNITEKNGAEFSVASSTGAAAGNRYEETVYAIPGSDPCMAIRYFIHYGVFENYAPGMVKEFDKTSLLKKFHEIRSTFVWNQ
ncbi:MAG: MliC family protein [Candidatus Paceibacterota bacterium]|jgi:membrane-bound inhibitor of C-type lysozyme|nr:MliC family protein [Candidatus Paceibacterota bacterium]